MRRIWKILIVAVVIGLAAVLLTLPHFHAKSALAAYREQLKARGEKMTIAELTPQLSGEAIKNGRDLVSAVSMLSDLRENPPAMHWISPGHALVAWTEEISPTYDSSNCWPVIKATLEKHPDEFAAMREVLARPEFGFAIDYQHGFSAISITYLTTIKKASPWLHATGDLAMHEKDPTNAWNDLEAGLQLVRKGRTGPLMIDHLVWIAIMKIQLAQTWEALQYPGWSDAQLAQLQQDWDSFSMLDGLETGFSLERLMDEPEFEKARSSYSNYNDLVSPSYPSGSSPPRYDSLGQILANPVDAVKAYLHYRGWKALGSYQEELCVAQLWQAALEAARQARTNDAFLPAWEDFKQAETNLLSHYPKADQRFAFVNQMTGATFNFLLKAADAETLRRMVVTAIALERHRLRHKEYPARLSDLTPEFLSKVSVDFMDGKPLRYRRKEDGTYLLYSVGEDGKDDGGDASPPPNYASDYKTWYKMRDAVWPMPATPDEVKKYEADALQKLSKQPPAKPVPQFVPKSNGTNSNTN